MPTLKRRINVSLTEEMDRALKFLSERDEVPQATKALHLIRLALEIEEDDVLNTIAMKRDKNKVKFVSHKNAWK